VTDQANTKAAGRRATETVEATADPRATAIQASPISSPDPRLRRHRPPLRRDRSGWAIPKNLARSTEATAIADGRWSIIQLRVTTGEWSQIPCRAGPSVFVTLAARPRQVSGGVFGGLGGVDVVVRRPRLELGDRQHRSTYSRRRWRPRLRLAEGTYSKRALFRMPDLRLADGDADRFHGGVTACIADQPA